MSAARLISLALLVLALAGCGGSETAAGPAGDPAELLERAPQLLREQETLAFSFHYTRTRADRADDGERYLEGEGALDLGADAGRMEVTLDLGLPDDPFDGPIELRWTRTRLTARVGGKSSQLEREHGRQSGGLVGRMPDEPAGLIGLLGRATEARDEGSETIDGVEVRRLSFVVDARAAGRARVPSELSLAAQEGGLGERLPLVAWVDGEGLVRRIAYEVRLPEQRQRPSGKLILPRRTIRGVYDLSDFGRSP